VSGKELLLILWKKFWLIELLVSVSFQVSGEYSMLIRGAESGLFDLDTAIMESLRSFRRAGTDVIISYFTPRVLKNFQANKM
jgi:delta-aminolevulinic acid dehydratase/porphobilinogen synthase